ncbi:hypothetical protein NDU88_004345 [Pleurodeles waltl]|uniref:Uncharacterized protein n=1 Tax=Pleurodeles waltl TaxID=8319 RepID=A0AAV7LP08_PLEWA|nr:hypothetical protein NDU88_004345 [Pleurodeles waltl]
MDCGRTGTLRPAVLPSRLGTISTYTNRTALETSSVAPHGAGIWYLIRARPDCAEAPKTKLNLAQQAIWELRWRSRRRPRAVQGGRSGDPLPGPRRPCLLERQGAATLSATQIESRCGGGSLSPLRGLLT